MKCKILLIIVLLIPIHVFADELIKIEFNCHHEDENNYICDVLVNSNKTIQAIDFKVLLPSFITKSEFILEDNNFGSGEDNWISIILDEPKSGNIKIGTYNLVSEKNVTNADFSTSEIMIVDENYQEIPIKNSKDTTTNQKNIVIKVFVYAIIILTIMYLIFFINNKAKKRGVIS